MSRSDTTVRLKDIAARAGVSLMTASKAMREASDVSAQTRARIRLLAQQMGYVPNSMAQGLRNRTTRLLGLVLSSVSDPILTGAVAAIEEGANEWGCDLLLAHTLNSPEREEACIRRMLARRVDGLFIFPTYRLAPTAAIYDVLSQRQTPTVILGQRAPFCAHFQNVESDDRAGSQQMTRHLLELGHKRIAFLCGPPGSPWAQDRLEGYRRALREAHIELDDRLIFTAGTSIEEGGKAALQMLNESVSVTAIQTANDSVAIGAANVFLNQGIKIPNELSIGGFGNILLSEHFRVPLTTVRQPKFRLGVAGMELMQRLLRGERAESKRLAAALIVRASTSAPKS
ncbi:MAG TPA: LacI family DNA-binding transcriptional regulator [Verrucomicrobiae bacterium]|jgi:DNA-binding LacI/PurR family transcriptional regulator|nr:LacI family DNA-binding transcriptional regulator [Verrucomicrobiae bacterium]